MTAARRLVRISTATPPISSTELPLRAARHLRVIWRAAPHSRRRSLKPVQSNGKESSQEHSMTVARSSGGATGIETGASCGTSMASTVMQCVLGTSCLGTARINGSASGLGASISYPPTAVWTHANNHAVNCGPETVPLQTSGGGGGIGEPCDDLLIYDPGDPGDPSPCDDVKKAKAVATAATSTTPSKSSPEERKFQILG